MRNQFSSLVIVLLLSTHVGADVFEFDFLGNGGPGLRPENQNPLVTTSNALGDEFGSGLIYDSDANELIFGMIFGGLDDGLLTAAASGIHIHMADPADPFNTNGGIVFNLNSGDDPNVLLDTPLIKDSATFGILNGVISLTETQEQELFNGSYYVNIHSYGFGSGELRGNLVLSSAVPEPATSSVWLATASLICLRRRRVRDIA